MVIGTGAKRSMCRRRALATLGGKDTSRTLLPSGSAKHSFLVAEASARTTQATFQYVNHSLSGIKSSIHS